MLLILYNTGVHVSEHLTIRYPYPFGLPPILCCRLANLTSLYHRRFSFSIHKWNSFFPPAQPVVPFLTMEKEKAAVPL